ncbi:MAG TPA: AAA family ATPase [Acidobacteriota bacterium]|nr:AAA family ATPase [Acidobacteriota bacterium]
MQRLEDEILSYLLIDFSLINKTDINTNLFLKKKNRDIFRASYKLFRNNGTHEIDISTLAEKLEKKKITASELIKITTGTQKLQPANFAFKVQKLKQQRLAQKIIKETDLMAREGKFEIEKAREYLREIESISVKEKPKFENLDQFIKKEIPERESLIEPILGRSEITMIHGRPKIGKSLLTLQIVKRLITGKNWLGFEVHKLKEPILIIQVEIAASLMQQRVKKIFKDTPNIENIIIPEQSRNIFLDQEDGQAHVASLIKDIKPGLVILDPYMKFFSTEENAFKKCRPFFDFWFEQIEINGLSMLFVHHDAKFQEGKLGGQKALGSTEINASTDGNWSLERIQDAELNPEEFLRTSRLSFESRNWANLRPLNLRLNDDLYFDVVELPKSSCDKWDIVEEIENAGGKVNQSKLRAKYSNPNIFYKAKEQALKDNLIDSVKLENVRGKPVMLFLKNGHSDTK